MPRVGAACTLVLLGASIGMAGTFSHFETGHVRPLAISPDDTWLFAVNTPDARLAVYALSSSGEIAA
jgi:6-phosphogluconolactonase (cycloisomerase 2 family)